MIVGFALGVLSVALAGGISGYTKFNKKETSMSDNNQNKQTVVAPDETKSLNGIENLRPTPEPSPTSQGQGSSGSGQGGSGSGQSSSDSSSGQKK